MEVCVPDSCGSGGSLRKPLDTSLSHITDISVSDLKACLNEVLVSDGIDVKLSGETDGSSETREDDVKEIVLVESKSTNSTSKKSLHKCATIPLVREQKSSVDGFFCIEQQEGGVVDVASEGNASVYSVNLSQSCPRSISLPTTRRLISALKGSRERHGIQSKKLSITWAPDVYDPIPSSVSHVPSSKNQRHRSDGKRKNKQKRSSKSSRSSKDKEKKQNRKTVGTPRTLNEVCETSRAVEFIVGQSNPSCGNSLLKDSLAKLHYPVAEAT